MDKHTQDIDALSRWQDDGGPPGPLPVTWPWAGLWDVGDRVVGRLFTPDEVVQYDDETRLLNDRAEYKVWVSNAALLSIESDIGRQLEARIYELYPLILSRFEASMRLMLKDDSGGKKAYPSTQRRGQGGAPAQRQH